MGKMFIIQDMSEDNIGELRDEVKAYKGQLDSLKEDLEIVIKFANPHLIGHVNQYATGFPGADPAVREKCLRFLERHRPTE